MIAFTHRIAQSIAGAVLLIGLNSAALPAAHAATPTPAPARDVFYAVDNASDDGTSQFYIVEVHDTLMVTPLGSRTNHDFEDVAISNGTHDVFAATGGDVKQDKGTIYRVDGLTGALTLVGKSGFDRITILKFRDPDDTLWGWAEGKGLVQIDPTTGKGTLVFPSSKKFEGMAWQPDGTLALAIDTKLYLLDLAAHKLKLYASNLPKGTESLFAYFDDTVIGGATVKGKTQLFSYDLASRSVKEVAPFNSPFKSIEGLCGYTEHGE